MKKQEIIARMAKDAGLTNAKAVAAYDSIIRSMSETLAEGKRVMLGGFGSLQPVERKARQVLHPVTKEPLQIERRRSVKFKPGPRLQDLLDDSSSS
jgi:nucleoid DNA-binding protein